MVDSFHLTPGHVRKYSSTKDVYTFTGDDEVVTG